MKSTLVLLLAACVAVAAAVGGMAGGYTPIEDFENDTEVQEVVQFAVDHINGMINSISPLHLKTVLSAERQVVAGLQYHFVMQLEHESLLEKHEVTVWVDPSGNMMVTDHRMPQSQ